MLRLRYDNLNRLNLPYLAAIFSNGAVGGKSGHSGHGLDGFFQPFLFIGVGLVYLLLTVNIGLKIGKEHILVIIFQGVKQWFE